MLRQVGCASNQNYQSLQETFAWLPPILYSTSHDIHTFPTLQHRRFGPADLIAQPGVEYYGYGAWPNAQSLGQNAYAQMAAAQLAKKHFVS